MLEPSPEHPGKLRSLLTAGAVLVALAFAGGYALPAWHNASLVAIVQECPSHEGLEVAPHYGGLLSRHTAILDLKNITDGSVRRVDLVHFVLQFGNRLDKSETRELVLARRGHQVFRIESRELLELTHEYVYGNPLWSIRSFPERLRTMDGRRAFPVREGGMLYVLEAQMKDLEEAISRWTGR